MSVSLTARLRLPPAPVNNLGRRQGSSLWAAIYEDLPGSDPLAGSSGSRSSCKRQPREIARCRWTATGVGVGVALAASRKRKSRKDAPQEPQEVFPADGSSEESESSQVKRDDEDEAWVFWEEQQEPTLGAGNLPRHKEAEPLPNPLPSLTPPAQADFQTGGRPELDQGQVFQKAYGKSKSTIMDTDGMQIEVKECSTFEAAVQEFNFPACLHASLARRDFYHLTPVQQCTIPLLLNGRDFVASAFTGSGKTAAYLLPILKSLEDVSRLVPGTLVAAHFKTKSEKKSEKPALGRVRGFKHGQAAIEFEVASGKTHRQFVPPEWVVGSPTPTPRKRWEGPVVPVALVLVPTRELSEQVHKEAKEFLPYSQLRSACLYGDAGLRTQWRDLAHGADILVATPGRLVDALHKGLVRLEQVKHLVLDEVDRMMELGFGDQLEEIIQQGAMPSTACGRQTSFWSATIPYSVRQLVEAFLGSQCVWVDCTGGQTNPIATTVSHEFIDARPYHRTFRKFEPGDKVITKGSRRGTLEFQVSRKKWRVKFTDKEQAEHKVMKKGQIWATTTQTKQGAEDRLALLQEILLTEEFQDASVIVFCRRRDTVMEVYKFLKEKFLGVAPCHGGMTHSFRSQSIQKVKDGKADVLVATDIAARGLDLPNVTHVVNYELPLVIDEFVHRCGRTGRIGRKGTAVTFVTGREKIFSVMRRTIMEQGHWVPPWCSLQGLQLSWKHRHYKLPFRKREKGIPQDSSQETVWSYMENSREQQLRQKAEVMLRAAEAEGQWPESLKKKQEEMSKKWLLPDDTWADAEYDEDESEEWDEAYEQEQAAAEGEEDVLDVRGAPLTV